MRKYKYIWVPSLIGIYFLFMTIYFGVDLLAKGETLRFWGTVAAESVILIALVYFMKKRDKLRQEREEDIKNNQKE